MDFDILIISLQNEIVVKKIRANLIKMGIDCRKIVWQKAISIY